jgi:hypothetical protein
LVGSCAPGASLIAVSKIFASKVFAAAIFAAGWLAHAYDMNSINEPSGSRK